MIATDHPWSRLRLAGTILIPLLGLVCYFSPFADCLQRLSFDLPFLFHRQASPEDVVLVYLDEAAARTLNQPLNDVWDRSLHTQLLHRLTRDGARLVFYDIVFSSPSADPAVDQAFAEAITRHGAVILGGAIDVINQQGVYSETVYPPALSLQQAAVGWGLLLLNPIDPDYAVRQFISGTEDLATASWIAAGKMGGAIAHTKEPRLLPRWLNYYGPPETYPSVSFHQALYADGVKPGYFKDKFVFIGGRPVTNDIALGHDEFANPYSRWGNVFMTGLEVHATEFSNLLRGDWLSRLSPRAEVTLLLIFGLLIGWLANFVAPRPGITGMVILAGLVTIGTSWLVWKEQVWCNWLIPVLVQMPAGLLWSTGSQYFTEAKKRAALRQAFSLYLSPQMADRVAEAGFDLKPGSTLVEATVMFTDCQGFTTVAEELNDPLKVAELLVAYFNQISRCILQNDGTIIKYIGDSVMAVWGAPLADVHHADKATRAALQLHEASKVVVRGRVLATRVGLCTGQVAAGNLGSDYRFDYTVIGDTVNIASRLEQLNKLLGTSVLLAGETSQHLSGRFRTRHVGYFAVAGKSQGVSVHELLSDTSPERATEDWLATFNAALTAIKSGAYDDAKSLFHKAIWARGGADGPSAFYLTKMADLEKAGALETWTGVIKLTEV